MDRTTFDRETAVHRRLYEAHREQIRRDYAGKYVTLAEGRILAVTPTFAEGRAAVERRQPVPEYYLIFPADMEPAFDLNYDL